MTPFNLNRCMLFAASLFVLAGCIKDEPEIIGFEYSASPEWGVPIASVSISAQRVIENFDNDGILVSNGDGLISLVYADTLDPIGISDFLILPDQQVDATFALDDLQFAELISEGTFTLKDTRLFEFNGPVGDRLDSIRFNGGLFALQVISDSNIPLNGFLAFLDPSDDSELYRVDFDGLPPLNINVQASLENVLLKFINDSDLTNGMKISYELNFEYGGTGTNSAVNVNFGITDFGIKTLGGYLVPRTFAIPGEGIGITMFDDTQGANIRIEDPRLNFYFANEFGLGVLLNINGLFGSNRNEETIVVPGANITPLPVLAAAPTLHQASVTKVVIDNSLMTPSITDFLAFQPNFLSGDFSITINPLDDPSVFLSGDSELGISYEVEIPVYGSIANFSLRDTASIGLGDIIAETEENADIAQVDIRLITDNGLPLDAALQIVFTDSLFQAVDSLFTGILPIVSSAPVELNLPEDHPNYGRALGSTRNIVEIPIPRERILALQNVSHIIIKVQGHTTGNGDHPIRLFEDNKLDARIAAKIKLRFDE